ncbi:MAG: TIGR02996 domain-containing protein [Gemmataceae bacterium]
MLTHEDAFLASIVEHPDDDAPRLIFADWLDDHGNADRAEFIRVQVESARVPPSSARGVTLLRREAELRQRGEDEWRTRLPQLDGVSWEGFSRGFVEAVFVETVEQFLQHADALFAAAPLRSVQIGTLSAADAARLAVVPDLVRLQELNLGNNPTLGRDGVRALAGSPHLANLTALLLHYNDLGDDAVRDLARSPYLTRLVELYLSGNDLGDPAAVALAGAFPRLRDLDLRDNRIADPGVLALADAPERRELTTLYLVNNTIGPLGAHALAASPHLPHLARLYLNYNPVGDEGALAFADARRRDALLDLDLRHCQVHDAGGLALARSLYLPRLELLWLSGNGLSRDTRRLLRARFGARLRL